MVAMAMSSFTVRREKHSQSVILTRQFERKKKTKKRETESYPSLFDKNLLPKFGWSHFSTANLNTMFPSSKIISLFFFPLSPLKLNCKAI